MKNDTKERRRKADAIARAVNKYGFGSSAYRVLIP
jgi:hypothetical protein